MLVFNKDVNCLFQMGKCQGFFFFEGRGMGYPPKKCHKIMYGFNNSFTFVRMCLYVRGFASQWVDLFTNGGWMKVWNVVFIPAKQFVLWCFCDCTINLMMFVPHAAWRQLFFLLTPAVVFKDHTAKLPIFLLVFKIKAQTESLWFKNFIGSYKTL